jgi:N-acetylneuraminate synthase
LVFFIFSKKLLLGAQMNKTYVIAEIGINHNGDIGLAKDLIKGASTSGCNAVKFQKRTIEDVYTKEELDKPRESPWGTTNRQQKEGLEFSIEQYKELYAYTKELGMDFIVSCWDLNSIDVVEENLDVDYHKVASALATDKKFLQKLNDTGKPVILSTGMCTEEYITAAVDLLTNVEYLLACTSTYPTVPKEVNLKHISVLKSKYPNLKIGFSNHYNGQDACIAAVALGAQCIEFHITKDRSMYGSDQSASIEKYTDLVIGLRNMELMLGDGVKEIYPSEVPIEKKLRKNNTILEK